MKRLVILLIILVFIAGATETAFAGSKNRYRLEGLAIGIGSMLLMDALLDDSCPQYCVPKPHVRPCGHWEIRRRWIPPEYRRVWCEGHYDRCRRWIAGHWARVRVRDGHYRTKRIWVGCR